jgi:hypothetical protein
MEQDLCEPVELTEFELDAVAGGNPFSSYSVFGNATTNNNGSFAIGLVQGDYSDANFSTNAGQVNTFGINLA